MLALPGKQQKNHLLFPGLVWILELMAQDIDSEFTVVKHFSKHLLNTLYVFASIESGDFVTLSPFAPF